MDQLLFHSDLALDALRKYKNDMGIPVLSIIGDAKLIAGLFAAGEAG